MKLKIHSRGMGVNIPKIDLGVGLTSTTYLLFTKGNSVAVYQMQHLCQGLADPGNKSFLLFSIETPEMEIGDLPDDVVFGSSCKLADIELKGFVAMKGIIDIEVKLHDTENQPQTTISKAQVTATGYMISDVKCRATLLKIMEGSIENPVYSKDRCEPKAIKKALGR